MSWPTKKLGEICEVVGGGTPSTSVSEYWNGDIVWITPKDMGKLDSYEISGSNKKITKTGLKNSSAKLLAKGAVVLSSRAPIGYVAIADVPLATNQGCRSFICDESKIYNHYLLHFLLTKTELLNHLGGGSTFKEISGSKLKELEIPLPPLAEQKKIVARLEGLLGKIKEAKRLRAEAQEAARNLLPAELHRLFTQPIRQAYGKQHSNILENVGMSGKPASVKNSGEAQWEEKELGEVVSIEANKNTKPLPYVGMEDIESGTGKFIGSKEKRAVRSTTSYFTTDHVLYGKLRPYLNKFLVPDFEGHCTTEFLPLRPDTRFLTREWLAVWLRHDETVSNIMATTTGSRMPRANMNLVKKFKIPLPPVAEQKKIVARLDSLSEKIRRLREYQNSTASDFISLEQSIVSHSIGSTGSLQVNSGQARSLSG